MTKEKEKKVGKEQPLLDAARLGRLEQLETILNQFKQLRSKKKSNPLASLRKAIGPNNIRDPVTGFTCLHHASLNGHSDCVQLILNYGAKPNAVDYKGSSALHLAAWAGNLEVVKVLLNQRGLNSSPPAGNGNSPQGANTSGQSKQKEASPTSNLGKHEIDIDLCNNDNQTPLSLAAQFGHNEVVNQLLAHGANVHIRNNQLESPLDLACLNGKIETVRLILESAPSLLVELRRNRSTVVLCSSPSRASFQYSPTTNNRENAPTSDISSASGSPSSGGHHSRRASGGWAFLLRGRRESQTQTATATSSSSPLQRLTTGTLSMRQKSIAAPAYYQTTQIEPNAQQSLNNNYGSPGREELRRRATLSVGAPLLQNCQAANWSQTIGDLGGEQQASATIEKLLDHSPLHYATKRGHLELVKLLLNIYQANLLQVTSIGGVLHEVALSDGKNSDMIGLFFGYIETSHAQRETNNNNNNDNKNFESRLDLLDKFLNLRNLQQRTVFDELNKINNRSAQEIKRIIYEFSEQLQRSVANQANFGKQAERLKHQLASSQQQQAVGQQPKAMQFSDIQQINSFVTMKRVPKQRQALKDTGAGYLNQVQPIVCSTQTIDRRGLRHQNGHAWHQHQHQPAFWPTFGVGQENAQVGKQLYYNQQQELQQNQNQLLPIMTRSVSNLNGSHAGGETNLMWRHWLTPDQLSIASNGSRDEAKDARKRRSKSRDLGSLMVEAQQQRNLQQNNPVNMQPIWVSGEISGQQSAGAANMVRSQTDCSQLMGRVFEQANQQIPSATSFQQEQLPVQNPLDRKMINRHYHVYDHQFYPPRLLNQRPEGVQKQAVAMVAPASDRGELLRGRQLQLDMGSDGGVKVASLAGRSLDFSVDQQQQIMDRFVGRHSRRLAAPPSSSVDLNGSNDRCASVDQRRQDLVELQRKLQAESSSQQQQQHHQQLHNSYSLESHLSEPHLFESTRKALMRDFDQLIGRELLNRNHRPIIDGVLGGQQSHHQPSSSSSALTSVSLDMDTYGERLTVSGVRTTIPQQQQLQQDQQDVARSKRSSNSSALEAELASLSSRQSSTGSQNFSSATNIHQQPPPKPPRPSLASRQRLGEQRLSEAANTANRMSRQRPEASRRSIIYDLPATASARDEPLSSNNTSISSSSSGRLINRGSQLPATTSKASLTEPPKVRPPPPPQATSELTLSTPLHVLAPSEQLCCSSHPNSNSSTGSSSTNEIGLLKMASCSITSNSSSGSHQILSSRQRVQDRHALALALANQSGADPDSGVCTSNSPASMSHDSEDPPIGHENRTEPNQALEYPAIVRHLTRGSQRVSPRPNDLIAATATNNGRDQSSSTQTPIFSPPSPSTAQLCIEEAFIPLAQSTETASQTVCASINDNNLSAADNSLGSFSFAQSVALEADYENCKALQLQLGTARSSSAGNLLHLQSGNRNDRLTKISSPASLAVSSPSSISSQNDEDDDYAASEISLRSHSSESTLSKREIESQIKMKEIMLKVVIDESESAADGDQVFYVNPLELKRIANDGESQTDAMTLTDEELCAVVDKSSGSIRFTLKKRRNADVLLDDQQHLVSDKSPDGSVPLEHETRLAFNTKKTKLNLNNEQSEVASATSRLIQVRRHSEMSSCGPASNRTTEQSGRVSPSLSFSEVRNVNAELTSANDCRTILSLMHQKQEADKLKQWFSTNLVGLAEYSSLFLQHGLDNIQFLNNQSIINDQMLKSIGIDNDSHRLLIVERISKELPLMNLEDLLIDKDQDQCQLTVSKLLERLQIHHPFDDSLITTELPLNNNSIDLLRTKLVSLPIGYRLRLSLALNLISTRLSKEDGGANQKLTVLKSTKKQASNESGEVEMDTSQASATSSSSKESIKSIVSARPSQPEVKEAKIVKERQMQLSEEKLNENEKDEEEKPTVVVGNRIGRVMISKSITGNSLVSETARKLEEAAARNNGNSFQRPIAAARKINNNKLPEQSKDFVPVNRRIMSANESKPIQFAKNNTAFVPVKSVCWPPKSAIESNSQTQQQQEDPTSQRSEPLPFGKLSTYQRLFDGKNREDAQSGGQTNAQKSRPKPAPPAKPAKLATTKFNANNTNLNWR